jgi:7-cyano-7-deazaguanine synthase
MLDMVHRAVCLVSGGIDSCVTAFIARSEEYEIYALSFDYGQLHKRELDSAEKIARAVNAKKHVIFNVDLRLFGGSSLVDKSFTFPKDRDVFDQDKKRVPSTYVPARNTVFLSIALAFAEVVDADAIFIGATATDYSGYPDCRPEYIRAFQTVAHLGTRRGVEGRPITIKAPLLHMKKSEIIKKGLQLNAPLGDTWSCYVGGRKACGRCDSCLFRLKGFKEAGVRDQVKYEQYPRWYQKIVTEKKA